MDGFLGGKNEQATRGFLEDAAPVEAPAVAVKRAAPAPAKSAAVAAPAPSPAPAPAVPKWADVIKRPSYQALTGAERELARAEYFNAYVAPDLAPEEVAAAKDFFIEQSRTLDPTLMQRAGKAIAEFTGTTPEQIEAGKFRRMSVPEKAAALSKQTPGAFDNLPLTPEYLRTLQANWNAATPAQRTELAKQDGYMGYVAKKLNERQAGKPVEQMPADPLGIQTPQDKMRHVSRVDEQTRLTDTFDPRAEARARQLVRNGMNPETAQHVARDAAYRDVRPGLESGANRIEASTFDFEAREKFNNDPFFSHPLVRASVKGYEGYKLGSLGVAQFVGDLTGADEFAGDMAEGAKKSRDFTGAMGDPTNGLQRNFEGAISSIAQQLPSLVGGVATGSEALVLGSMFAQVFGQEYSEGRARGHDIEQAATRASLFGAFEVVGERLGLKFQLDALRKAADGVPTPNLADWLANTVTKEIPGELATTTGQFLTDKLPGLGLRQDATLGDYLSQVGDTVVQTVMQGGIMSGATNAVSAVAGMAGRERLAPSLGRAGNPQAEREIAAEIDRQVGEVDFVGIDAAARAATDPNNEAINPASTRIPRKEPVMDSHAAGLTPDQQAVDKEAQEAFSDLTNTDFLDDEVPASLILGTEAKQDEPAAPKADNSDLDSMFDEIMAETAAPPPVMGDSPAAPAPKGKLTPFVHPLLDDVMVRGELAYMADQAGWEQVGGKMLRSDATDQTSDVTGRTSWIPKQPWYQMMPERLNEEATIEAVGKALTGQPMTAKEKRVIANMLDFAKASIEDQQKWRDQAYEETGATSPEEYAQIAGHADKLEELDADIPFDLNDPRTISGDQLTDEEIDAIFNQQGRSVPQDAGAKHAGQGAQGSGTPQAAGPETFNLEAETPDQVRAKEKQTEKTKAAERKAKADAEAKEKADREKKDIRARGEAAADNFQLGEDPEAALSGQKDIFGDAPKTAKASNDKRLDGMTPEQTYDLHEAMGLHNGLQPNTAKMLERIKAHPDRIEGGFQAIEDRRKRDEDTAKAGEKHGFKAYPQRGLMGTPLILADEKDDERFVHVHHMGGGEHFELSFYGTKKVINSRPRSNDLDALLKEAAEVLREDADPSITDEQHKANFQRRNRENGMRDAIERVESQKQWIEGRIKRGEKIVYERPTEAELRAGRAAVDKSPFFYIEGMVDHVVFKARYDHKDHPDKSPVSDSPRVIAQRFENGKADRWSGPYAASSFDIIERDGKLWHSPRLTGEVDAYEMIPVKLLDKATLKPGAKPKTEKEAKARKDKAGKPSEDSIKIAKDSLYQRGHKIFERFAEFTVDTPWGEMQVSMSGATNPVSFESIYGEPGGIINVRTPVAGGGSNERAGITYHGALTLEKAKEIALQRISDEFAGVKPKAKTAKKAAPKEDLNDMFDELMAEEATPKAAHELTQAEYRQHEGRGKTGGLAFAKINLDNETVESLLKNHRQQVPALGMMMGAKGGKSVPKVAADIMRIWRLRGELSKATAESLAKLKLPELKALAKQVGIYTGVNKPQLVDGIIKWRDDQRTKTADRLQDAKHFLQVRDALKDGKSVPAPVLKDYADLSVEFMPRDSAEYKHAIGVLAGHATHDFTFNAYPARADVYRKQASEQKGKDAQILSDIADRIEADYASAIKAMGLDAPAKPREPRTAGEAAVSAAKNTGAGLANAIDGLGALFGGSPGTLGSGPVINEDTYAKAKPLFEQAIQNFSDAAADIRDVMRAVIQMVTAKFGAETTVKMKPYIVRFIADYREGTQDEPTTSTDSQSAGQNNPDEKLRRDPAVHDGSKGAGSTDSGPVGKAPKGRNGPAPDLVVHDDGTAAGGKGSRVGVSGDDGKLQLDRNAAEPGDAGGSGGAGQPGATAPDAEPTGDVQGNARARDVKKSLTFSEKVQAQKEAESIPVKLGDKANIDATLPLLLEGQREDVLFAENRLAKPDGYGVLFANGTGTGKTYLSLGIVKRLIKSGKKNGIVLVPNQEVMNEWLASAPNLGIDLYKLEDKNDKGRGVAITTYANFGDNDVLLDRDHDFVVADEAHNLMANKEAADTLSLRSVRALAMHPRSAYRRTTMLHRDLYRKITALRAREDALMEARDKGQAPIGSAQALTEIADELRPLVKKFNEHLEVQKELLASVKPEDRPRLIAVSATPFAWEKNVQWAEGFLFHYPKVAESRGYNEPDGYQKYMIQNFGYHMKHNKLNEPDAKVNRGLMQVNYNMNLRKAGVLSTRMLDVDKDYDRKFILVDGGIGARIDAALEWLRKEKDGIYSRYYKYADDQFDFLTKSRLLEAIKAKAVVDIINDHHKLGRKVVVFHDYNQGGGFAPFNFPGDPDVKVEINTRDGGKISYTHGEFRADFAKAFPDLVGDDLAKLKSPIETLRAAFPNALFNNGLEKKKDALAAIKAFNDDDNKDANLLVVQSAKNAGWSGHDKTGKYMRVSINLGLPTAPVKSIQLEGRTYRTGQMSDSPMRYLNTGTMFERVAFANSIATRSETAENLAMGDFARGLKQSFIQAFQESDVYPAGPDDGKGGKEQDRRTAGLSAFDQAKSHYYSQHKKNSRTKAQEGADYFATPEPIGFKMVEWLGLQSGDSVMEPSAGHGAIARWFPEDMSAKVIEPSAELASRLALAVADPSGVINDTFENHNIINKYDGIAMNPPFGTSGKLAMEHVAKAFAHLKEGGRLIAIIPQGPAMDKRLNDWLTGSTTTATGIVKLNVPDAKFEHAIELPGSTFARAGTGVMTRVIIIDRVKGGNDGSGKAPYMLRLPEEVRHGDVNALFDYIEHMTVPGRPPRVAEAPAPSAPTSIAASTELPGVKQYEHGRVVDDAAKASFRVVGAYLETDAPVAKVTTAAGKELEGVYVPDAAMAKAVDRFTWKPKGAPGYFVRIKHVVRPQPSVFSRAEPDALGATEGAENRPAVTEEVANHVIGRIAARFKGGIPGVTFKVVETFDQLPPFVKADAEKQDVGNARGVYARGVVYVIRDTNHSAKDVEETVFHELYGHAGLEKLFGHNTTLRLEQLFHLVGAFPGMAKIAKKNGKFGELWGYIPGITEHPDMNDSQRRRYMMEELLAHLAEKGPSFQRLFKEIIGALRQVLRKRGFLRMAEYNEADLFYVLRRARQAVGGAYTEGVPTGVSVYRTAGTAAAAAPAPRPLNLNPVAGPKLGLLDTPMRLAFEKTGALAVWRSAFRLLEKTAGAALNNRVGEVIKAGLIDRYGLSDAVIERHEEMRVEMIHGVRTADRFLDRLKGLSRHEYAVLYAAANNADLATVNDMIKELPEDSQKALHEIKEVVRVLGQMAVDLKMLDADTFKANELAYLHRSYLKHEADMTPGEQANRATRIKGDQFKARGLADIVSTDRLMKWMPEFWGTRVKDGAVTNGTVGKTFIRFERRTDPKKTDNLPGIEGVPALGRLMETVYWPASEPVPAKFNDWHREGEWTVRRVQGKDVVFRRDFTLAERRRMGEIEDIRYAMAKTLNIAVHDVEVGRYFEWLAEGHAKVPGDLPPGAKVIEDARKAESRFEAFTQDVWVKVPETKITGTGVHAYGKLAGRYVPGPVWTDIRAVNSRPFFDGSAGRAYEKLLRLWKISKTALSPAVHVNNVMANVVMADWHDVGGTHLVKAAVAWAKRGKDADAKKLVEDFQDHGGELGTYALTEMQRSQLAPILEELIEQARGENDLNNLVNAAGVMSLLREGMVRQAAATLGQSKIGRGVAAVPQKMIDVYQMEDQIFRLAAFIKARESGMTDREAGRFARKSFLDYDINAPWVVAAKQSGILPFIAFSYRAMPMLYKTMRDKPWKVLKLAMVIGAANAASAAFLGLSGDDEDDERRWLPAEKSGKVWGVVPKMVRMPWNTASDNPVFLDIRRFMPAGDITDTGGSHGAIPTPPFLTVGGPLALMAELLTNKSMFTGKDIVLDTDTGVEQAAKVLDHTYKWAMPNLPVPTLGTVIPGTETGQFQTYAWTGIEKAAKREAGTFGRDQNVPMAIGSAFGVKLEGYSQAQGMKTAAQRRDAALKELRMQEVAAKKQRAQGGLDDAQIKRKMEGLKAKEQKAKQEFGERASSKGLADVF